MDKKMSKLKIFKIVLTIIILVVLILMAIRLFPIMRNLSTPEGQMAFKQRIEESGVGGLLTLFGLQVAQIFLFIVPGEPIEILAGVCYGAVWGTIFIMLSAGIISTGIVFLVRRLGRKFVYEFCNEEKVNKIVNSKLFQNPKKIETIMIILFLIPGTPKDLLVYIGGLLPINPVKFIIISTLARFPSVISSTIAGANIAVGKWKIGILCYVGVVAVIGLLVFIMNKFDKDKLAKKALDEIK